MIEIIFFIEAQSKESGSITITLLHTVLTSEDATVTCTLDTHPVSKTTIVTVNPLLDTYQITGTLVDENGFPLREKNLVVYSDTPHYVTTDNFGFFYVGGLEKGEHEIYYIGEEDLEGQNKNKEEVIALASDEAIVHTNSDNVSFKKNRIKDSVIEPDVDQNVEVSFGEEKQVRKKYTRVEEYPEPQVSGKKFVGWTIDGETTIKENTIIRDNMNLIPIYNDAIYKFNISGSGLTLSNNNFDIKYNESKSVDISIESDYYFKSYNCDSGIDFGLATGFEYNSSQSVIVKYTSRTASGQCSITIEERNYPATATNNESCTTKKVKTNTCLKRATCCDPNNPSVCTPCNCLEYKYENKTTCTTTTTYSCPNGGTLSGTICIR